MPIDWAQFMQGGGYQDQQAQIDQQLADLLARRRQPTEKYRTGIGAALGGLGDILNAYTYKSKEEDLRSQRQALSGRMAAQRGVWADALRVAPQPTPEEGLQGMAASMNPFSEDPSATRKQMAAGGAQAATLGAAQGEQQRAAGLGRLRQVALAGMLSGDPTMAHVGQAEMGQAQQVEAAGESKRRFGLTQAMENRKLNIEQSKVDQDNWAVTADPVSGGFVMINKKDGTVRPIGPAGKPGAPPPLKPRDMDHDVQALSKELEGPSTMAPNMQALQDAADKGDVAGFGPIAGRVPNMFTSSEGVGNRQAAGRLMAQLLQMQSGKAVTEQEVERALDANGLKRTATPQQFSLGIVALKKQLAAQVAQREAGFRPEVVDTLSQRGGFTSRKLQSGAAPAATHKIATDAEYDALPPGTVFVGPDGKQRRKP